MPDRFRVRPADPAEYDLIGELTLSAYVVDGQITPGAEAVGYADQLRNAAARAGDADLLVAVDDGGTVVGTVTFCLPGSRWAELAGPGEAEFRMLAVDPAWRGLGVGAALTRACLDRAVGAGATSMVISTADTMHTAHRLYERLGFARDPRRDWRPAPGVRLLAYARPLP